MRVLVIGVDEQREADRVRSHAEAHPLLMLAPDSLPQPIGDDPAFCMFIPMGYRVVFSVEHQPSGKFRHLSVSVDQPGRAPNVPAMEMIMPLFGFKGPLSDCAAWPEDLGEGFAAINVMEKIAP